MILNINAIFRQNYLQKSAIYKQKFVPKQVISNRKQLREKRDAKREKIMRCMRLFNTICLTRLSFDQFGYLKSLSAKRSVDFCEFGDTSRAKGYCFSANRCY